MTETTLSVPEIHCGHCKMSIEGAVSGIAGVTKAEVDIEARTVSLAFDDPATLDLIVSAIATAETVCSGNQAITIAALMFLLRMTIPPLERRRMIRSMTIFPVQGKHAIRQAGARDICHEFEDRFLRHRSAPDGNPPQVPQVTCPPTVSDCPLGSVVRPQVQLSTS